MPSQCNVQISNSSHAASLSAHSFKGSINLRCLHTGQQLEFKPQHHWTVKNMALPCLPIHLVWFPTHDVPSMLRNLCNWKILLNELRPKRLIVKTNGSIRILGVMNQKPSEGTRINKSIWGLADMYIMSWTANYTFVWPQNNEEMMTELQISLLTDVI